MSDSISLNDFKKNLESGKYKKLAGARRAVGKFHGWSAATKEAGKKLVDSHFKVTDKPAKEPKRRGRPPGTGAKKATVAKAGAKTKAVRGRPRKARSANSPITRSTASSFGDGGDSKLGLHELAHLVATMSEAVKTIKECQNLTGKNEEMEKELVESVKILGRATQILGSYVSPVMESHATSGAVASEEAPVVEVAAPKARRGRKPKAENGTLEYIPVDAFPIESLVEAAPEEDVS